MLATAGEDRYTRVWDDPEDQSEALCVHCSQGSTNSETVTISAWCSEFGHTPFGVTHAVAWGTPRT